MSKRQGQSSNTKGNDSNKHRCRTRAKVAQPRTPGGGSYNITRDSTIRTQRADNQGKYLLPPLPGQSGTKNTVRVTKLS
jgi:hypothetical protein